MAESKKFWYIKLNVHFFEDDRIDWLCDQENGYAYVVLYLKLCLKTANNNGILTRQIGDMIIPYNVEKIAEATHIDIELVKVALELYKRIGLIYEADESCQYMRLPEVPGMVGYVTQAALDKRKQRDRKAETVDNVQDNVRQELRVKSKELRVKSIQQDKESKAKRKRFTPPTLDEVAEYCSERHNTVSPSAFVDYYEARGWKYGTGKPMADWKAAIRTWERRDKPGSQDGQRKRGSLADYHAIFEEMENR